MAPPPPVPPPAPEPPPAPPPGWLRWVPGLVGALVVVIAGLGVWWIWFQPAPPPGRPVPTAPTAAPGPGVIPRGEITAQASSTLPGTRQQSWDARRTIDGNPATTWQSDGFSDDGPPVILRWEFSRPIELNSIEIHNGYQADEARFWETARPASIMIVTESGEHEADLDDRMGVQTVELVGRTSYVEFRINSAHRTDADYPDLALSEVTFTGILE